MILFKPYGHLTKIGTDDFRLSLSVLIPDDYDLIHTGTQNVPADNVTRLTYKLISLPGQVHNAPKDFVVFLDDVPAPNAIEVVVQTDIESHELPEYIQDLISDITASPLLLGKTVLCTTGVEEGDDPREGVNPPPTPPDDKD